MLVGKDQICVMVILSMISYAHTRLQSRMENWHIVIKEIGKMLETHLLSNAVSECHAKNVQKEMVLKFFTLVSLHENIPMTLKSMDITNCKVKRSMGVLTSKRVTEVFGGMEMTHG